MSPRTTRWSLRPLSIVVLSSLLGATVVLTAVAGSIVRDQERRLLQERTREAAELISTIPTAIGATLGVLATLATPGSGSVPMFRASAEPFVHGQLASGIGAVAVTGDRVTVVDSVGTGPPVGTVVTGRRAAVARLAVHSPSMVAALLPGGSTSRRLGFDLRVGPLVMFEDVVFAPSLLDSTDAGAPFAELDGALYAADRQDLGAVVLSTRARLPLGGAVDTLPVPVGADRWLLVTRAKVPLIGSLAARAPIAVLLAGLLAAALTTLLAETLGRRRAYAEGLVEVRTVALRQATEAAEAANRSKSEFLSRMSHELRTPLNAVLGFAQLLQLDDLTASQAESVDQVVKGGRHLLDLINEVLDISRIDTDSLALSLEPVAAAAVVEETVVLLRPLAAARHVSLDVELGASVDRWVMADRQRLKQILVNLVANAVKYNRSGGSVHLGGAVLPGDRLRLSVDDTGPGIRSELLDRLFVPFERLGAERTEVEGTGVGLALSQRLAAAMGGAIGVRSTFGAGSCFWVDLPLADGPASSEGPVGTVRPATPAVGRPVEGRLVLHVEDNPSNVVLVEQLFARRHDLELVHTATASAGLDLARRLHPALALVDVHLPDADGDELLGWLRADPTTRDIPVVVVSADASPTSIDRLRAAGADAYLTKPFDLAELLRVIDDALSPAPGEVTPPAPTGDLAGGR